VSENKERGVVKWFNAARGYGFIHRASGEDVFVHFSAIQATGYRKLNQGEEVEFEVQDSDKGPQAVNVDRLGTKPAAAAAAGGASSEGGAQRSAEPPHRDSPAEED